MGQPHQISGLFRLVQAQGTRLESRIMSGRSRGTARLIECQRLKIRTVITSLFLAVGCCDLPVVITVSTPMRCVSTSRDWVIGDGGGTFGVPPRVLGSPRLNCSQSGV